ncbi:hypothetical protein [Paracoccus albus]|uniref:hypothetical protein n=1 Tax=Paracoccus albus TaxID=3017784 RepID=UPI0022F11542|nr:hypothetical protein [Paracoccus albus]WBU60939.1 hypothetical protein PAF20_03185 [Paracoccus albus]
MIIPPKQDESQIRLQGNPNDSAFWQAAVDEGCRQDSGSSRECTALQIVSFVFAHQYQLCFHDHP